jgi:hypothetical protein
MVSFAIAEEVSSLPLNNQLYGTTSLRDNALWFPDIPESHLQLNETYFTNSDTAISGFRPLCCEFGHVTNPGSLSEVKLYQTNYEAKVLAIDCHYDTGDVQRLGPPFNHCPGFTSTIFHYQIRSAARKKVDTISFVKKTWVSNYIRAYFKWFKGSHTQILQWARRFDEILPSALSPMKIASGSTLTGLYGLWVRKILLHESHQRFNRRWQDDELLVSLGAISEFLVHTP